MQNLTSSLEATIKNSAQTVEPFVEVDWVNGKKLTNIKTSSSSSDYVDFLKSQSPIFYSRFNESFDVIENMYTGPKPISHWRMNNATNTLAVSTNKYAIQDECGYNNLYINGAQGTNFTFGSAGVVQDNSGSLSTSINFTSAYAVSSQKDTQNRWSLVDNPNFSVECWIKPTTINAADGNFILYKDSRGYLRSLETGQIQLSSSVPEWTLNLDNGYPKFTIYNSNTGYWKPLENRTNIYVDVKSASSLEINKWYHIVITFDSKVLSMYVNNQLVASNNVLNGNMMDTTSGNLYVGARYFAWTSPPAVDTLSFSTYFQGHIDELAIYNTTLTLENIKQRWKTGSLNIGASNRTFNANHDHIKDYSGYGRNAFVYNPNELSSGVASTFTGIDFRPLISGSIATPFNGRKDGASIYFNDGTSIINYPYLTSDNTASGTSVFDGSAKLTVSGWMYVESKTVASQSTEMIAAYGTPDTVNNNFHATASYANGGWSLALVRQTNGSVNLSGSIYMGTSASPVVTYNSIPLNQWIHFVYSVDSSNRAVIMINGNTSTIATSTASSAVMNSNTQWKLFIGGRQSSEKLTKTYLSELYISNINADLNIWSTAYKSVTSINNFKGVNKFYDPLQVVNGQTEHTVTWAVLDSLDENGDPISANGNYYISERQETLQFTDYEYGWWSKEKSDGSGNFANPQKIYISFDPVFASHIDLYSSTKYGRIKSGVIRYKEDNGPWTAVNFTLTSASTSIEVGGGGAIGIEAIELTINSTLYPYDVARVQEFSPRWTEDISSRVVSMEISKVRENFDSSVPLGATGANTCNMVLDNTDLIFNPDNTGSDYYGLITPGTPFRVGYNYHTSTGIELLDQGTYYSDNWGIDSDNMTVSVSCRDFSGKMQDSTVVDGYLASNLTAGEAIGDLALRAGVPLSKLDIDKNYVSTVMEDSPCAFWRMNETSLESKSLYFNGSTYLYTHPFGDLLATGTSTVVDSNGLGTIKNTTVASKKVLPKTFYDFPTNECTIEFWIKCGTTSHAKTILNYSTKRFANEMNVKVSSTGYLVTQVQKFAPGDAAAPLDAVGVVSTTAISDNLWHHVSIVLDPAQSTVTGSIKVLYFIDGIDAGSGDIANFSLFRPSGQMVIGAGMTAGGISSNIATGPHTLNTGSIFVGHLREVKIWSTARTQNQILNGMNNPYQQQKINGNSSYVYKNMILAGNPVAYWPLDTRINSVTNNNLIRDISGYDRNAVQNGTSIVSSDGPILNEDSSRALYFGGTSSSLDVSNTTLTPFEGTGNTIASNALVSQYDFHVLSNVLSLEANLSMEFWIKPASTPSSKKAIMSKYDSTNTSKSEWLLSIGTDARISFEVYNTSKVNLGTLTTTNPIAINQWSHIAITCSGAKLQIFVNGQMAGQAFLGVSTAYATNLDSKLRIGNQDTGSSALSASLAHIAIYKRTLSAEEIYSHYKKAGYDDQSTAINNTGRLVCHWPMNQGKFYSYEDLNMSGFAYTAAGRRKDNIVPNVSKIGNYLFAYTTNTVNNPITQSMWKPTGSMAVKDSSGRNYASYRLGTSADFYDELNTANYVTYNLGSPISSEVEKSIQLNNTTSSVKNIAYVNYMYDCPLFADATTSFSLDFWIKPSYISYKQYLISRENFGTTVKAGTWRLYLDSDGIIKFEIYASDNSSAYSITPSGTPTVIAPSVWHHIGMSATVVSGNNIVTLYVDGQQYAQYIWSNLAASMTQLYVKTIIGGYGLASTNALIGSISNIAIYDYVLDITKMQQHYTRGMSLYQQIYASIGASSDSYWAEMLKIATADIGMFYFDENNNFVYEHGRSYDDALDTQHSEVQYEINDGNLISFNTNISYSIDNNLRTYQGIFAASGAVVYGQYGGASDSTSAIISGSQTVELQINKVIVKVYPPLTTTIGKSGIWAAESGTSLAICTLASNISATSTDSIPLTLTLNPAGIYEPLWPESGVIKIDDEFIRYKKSTGNTLFDLERGYWNSVPQSHTSGAVVGEAREFKLEWSSSPVYFVNYPFITGVIYDKTVVASNWRFNGLNGSIRLYPSDNAVPSSKYIVLEGNNPVTKLDNYFHVAGIVMSNQEKNKQNIVEISENYKDNIRRYGEKTLEIDNNLIQDAQYARDLAQYLLKKYSLPVPVLEVTTLGLPHLQLGDRIKINIFERMSILNGEYWIMSIDSSYDGGINQKMSLRKVS